eukprot:12555-Heterococcus_DN1.PRE.3
MSVYCVKMPVYDSLFSSVSSNSEQCSLRNACCLEEKPSSNSTSCKAPMMRSNAAACTAVSKDNDIAVLSPRTLQKL